MAPVMARTEASGFFETAWKTIRAIPPGRVSTYGDVARAMGRPGAARAVGTAMRENPDPGMTTPCHRIVRSDGNVGNYMGSQGGTPKKIRLLRDEGVAVDGGGQVVDFENVRWRFRRA